MERNSELEHSLGCWYLQHWPGPPTSFHQSKLLPNTAVTFNGNSVPTYVQWIILAKYINFSLPQIMYQPVILDSFFRQRWSCSRHYRHTTAGGWIEMHRWSRALDYVYYDLWFFEGPRWMRIPTCSRGENTSICNRSSISVRGSKVQLQAFMLVNFKAHRHLLGS